MKNVQFGLLAFSLCLGFAACGSDSKTTEAPSKCVAVTDADLLAADFLATSPNACGATMYAKYKHEGFVAVNNEIGRLALSADQNKLGTSFQTKIADANTTRQAEFGAHLLSFLESAYGNPNAYVGPAMTPAHAGLDITISQYQFFITDVVVPALKTVGVADSDIGDCFAPTVLNKDFVKTVVTCK